MKAQLQIDEHVNKFKLFEYGEMIYEAVIKKGIEHWEIYDIHTELGDMEISDGEISAN